ncbi:hypothetical protein L6452_30580 [Arctium lappa]|uniref:Uncharacterized protein n=1 Tax=Arctium lappa TaxID=4217 RepID=A0ACB8ZJ18_ARCLA|nr:hypothetical protein L6452_30580 [Arctium lappa]
MNSSSSNSNNGFSNFNETKPILRFNSPLLGAVTGSEVLLRRHFYLVQIEATIPVYIQSKVCGGGKPITKGLINGMGSWKGNLVYDGILVENGTGGLVTDEIATHVVALLNYGLLTNYPDASVGTFMSCGLITEGLVTPVLAFANYGQGIWFWPVQSSYFQSCNNQFRLHPHELIISTVFHLQKVGCFTRE